MPPAMCPGPRPNKNVDAVYIIAIIKATRPWGELVNAFANAPETVFLFGILSCVHKMLWNQTRFKCTVNWTLR